MTNPIQKVPWKVPFDVKGSGPYVVKVLLSDLLFEKPDQYEASTWVPWTSGGLRLSHDILLYDPSLFSNSGELKPSVIKQERQKKGFFLTKVTYDERANKTWNEDPYYKNKVVGDNSTAGYYSYDFRASLTPSDEIDYRSREKTYNLYIPPIGSDYYNDDDYYTQSCTVGVEGTSLETTAFLILTNRDEALEATLPGSALLPYTRIRANSDPSIQDVYNIVRFFTGYGVGDQGESSVKQVDGGNISAADTLDPTKNVVLQDVEIWLRCAYFADYVDPESYKQDLHQGSNVQHKNLILGTGDFEKFSRDPSDSETRPYLPTTPPRDDSYSAELISSNKASSFPIPPRAGEYNSPIEASANPLGWYDPDIEVSYGDIEHALPEEGNIFTSGRIFSPSVDELWSYIKKMVSGRNIDTLIDTASPKSANGSDLFNEEDTRLLAEPIYNLPDNKVGDPLDEDGEYFVNVGEGIQYQLNANIKYISDKITAGVEDLDYAPFQDHSDEDVPLLNRSRVAINAIQSNASWGLRSRPYSLREIEALVKNQQYNFEVAFNFIANNKVSTGNTDTEEANTHGTLYQLHRDFQPDLDARDPNSKWMLPVNTVVATETVYGETLPGNGTYIKADNIAREDVYLSAEGKWRYLFDHVRIPVLDEQY